jgi:hypothetical protein
MNRELLATLERSLMDAARFWILLMFDDTGHPIASATMCLCRSDAADLAPHGLRGHLRTLRSFVPGVTELRLLFCGPPGSLAESSVRMSPEADPDAVSATLATVLDRLCRETRAHAVIVKDLSDEHGQHTEEVLLELLGCSWEDIGRLREQEII